MGRKRSFKRILEPEGEAGHEAVLRAEAHNAEADNPRFPPRPAVPDHSLFLFLPSQKRPGGPWGGLASKISQQSYPGKLAEAEKAALKKQQRA